MSDFRVVWLRRYLRSEPRVVFDVGSYDAGDSIRIKEAYPASEVYAFEASPRNYKERVAPRAARFRVRHFNLALCEKNGTAIFHDSFGASEASGSILAPTTTMSLQHPDVQFNAPVSVPATTIEQFCEEHSIGLIDFLHMDVQGAEGLVLSGMGRIKARMIFLEACESEKYQGASSREQLSEVLKQKGYTLVRRLPFDDLYLENTEYQAYVASPLRGQLYDAVDTVQNAALFVYRPLVRLMTSSGLTRNRTLRRIMGRHVS